MIELCYISHAKTRYDSTALIELLKKARINNTQLQVTGLLLYDNRGTFIQVLEGPKETVMELYKKISEDDRHNRVNLIGVKSIAERGFSEWKMGFRTLDLVKYGCIEGLSDFLGARSDDQRALLNQDNQFGINMLHYFKSKTKSEFENHEGI